MKSMNGLYVKMMNKIDTFKKNERGSQTLEWVGIAAVIIIAVGLVSTVFKDSEFGKDVYDKFKGFLDKIGSEG